MRNTILRGGLVLAVLLTVAAPAFAQSLVRGVVVDAKNQPVEGALVEFEAVNFVNKRDVKTDRRGEFIFQGLQSGDYNVTASKEGVGRASQQVTISLSQKAMLTFQLVPPQAAAASSAAGLEAVAAGAALSKEQQAEAAALKALAAGAMEAYKAGNYQESATQLSQLVEKLPACADCYLYLGNSYVELKQPEQAEAALKKAVEVTPSVEGYTALTRLYNSQRKFDQAAEASQKAAELAKSPGGGAAAPGAVAAGGADAAGGAAPAADPSAGSETLYNQGVVLWNAGKYAEAKTQFEAAIKANPNNALAHYQLGMASLNLGQIPEARAAFEAYLKLDPDGPQAAQVKTFLAQLPK